MFAQDIFPPSFSTARLNIEFTQGPLRFNSIWVAQFCRRLEQTANPPKFVWNQGHALYGFQ
jgi:hypothetical protein